MPVSKRARVVPTSKTKKNRKELVRKLHVGIQTAADQYNYVWVFDVQNMRNSSMKDVRSQLSDSRFVKTTFDPTRHLLLGPECLSCTEHGAMADRASLKGYSWERQS